MVEPGSNGDWEIKWKPIATITTAPLPSRSDLSMIESMTAERVGPWSKWNISWKLRVVLRREREYPICSAMVAISDVSI